MKTFLTFLISTFVISAVVIKSDSRENIQEITEMTEPKVLTSQEVIESTSLYKEVQEFEKQLRK